MVLEEMSHEEKEHYFPNESKEDIFIYSKIKNPLSFKSYGELISSFLEHPNAYRLGVRKSREWIRFFSWQIPLLIGYIEEVASSDCFQNNHLYLVFKKEFKSAFVYIDRHQDSIQVAKIFAPSPTEDLFTLHRTTERYGENKAVSSWVISSKRHGGIKKRFPSLSRNEADNLMKRLFG